MIAEKRKKRTIVVDKHAAILKFQTFGPTACPLTTQEAAVVVGIQPNSLGFAVQLGKLKRAAPGRYMPDDLRAFMGIELPKGKTNEHNESK